MGCLLCSFMVGLKSCASQVCCSQSPCPRGRPLLTHTSPGDTQTLKGRSGSVYCGVPGSWCTQGFVWVLWAALVGMGFDSKHDFALLPSCWGFSFALGHGVSFFWWDPRFSLMAASIYSSCWGLHGSGRQAWEEVPCCFKAWARPEAAIGRALELYRHNPQSLLRPPRPAPASSPTSLRPEGLEGLGSRSQSASHHTLCCRDHTNTHTHIPILTSIRKNSSPSPNPSHGSSWQIGLSKISPSSLPASQEFVFRKERTMLVFEPQTWPREGRRAFLPWAPQWTFLSCAPSSELSWASQRHPSSLLQPLLKAVWRHFLSFQSSSVKFKGERDLWLLPAMKRGCLSFHIWPHGHRSYKPWKRQISGPTATLSESRRGARNWHSSGIC